MGKYTPRNPMWPDWFDGKKIDEVTFCGLFLYDHSDGFWRRQLVLTTKDRPTDREDAPFLVEALSKELEGILLWCLEGLQRLLRN